MIEMRLINQEFQPSFLGDVEFEAVVDISNFGRIEVARCSIMVVCGLGQEVQNCFTGISNQYRSSSLG